MALKYALVSRNWFKVGNVYHLLAEVEHRVFTTSYIVYNESDDIVQLNKTIKENDLIEKIKREIGVRVKFI